ncbi:hypothetical protein AA313_de0204059 [Arthrobotrys entomopaga]|nr:hypothetical protein AA313_de0204059 [Arthrobotrys entomopaga]
MESPDVSPSPSPRRHSNSNSRRHHHHHRRQHSSRQPDIQIPERDASIGGTQSSPLALTTQQLQQAINLNVTAALQPSHPLNTNSQSSREHRRKKSTSAPPKSSSETPAAAAESKNLPLSLRVRKGKGRVFEPGDDDPADTNQHRQHKHTRLVSPTSSASPAPPLAPFQQQQQQQQQQLDPSSIIRSAKPLHQQHSPPNPKKLPALHIEPRKSSLSAAKPSFTR